MSTFLDSINDVIVQATTGATQESLHQGMLKVNGHLASSSNEERNEALTRLSLQIPLVPPLFMGRMALLCGSLVERGGSPEIGGEALVARLPEILSQAIEYYELCLEKIEPNNPDKEEDAEQPDLYEVARSSIREIYQTHPEAVSGYLAEEGLSLGVIAHLGRSKKMRAVARTFPNALKFSNDRDTILSGSRSFLTKMLLTLDDEPFLILHPEQGKGYRVTVSSIPDNFQLHTVLMGNLLGDPSEGWLDGKGFDLAKIRYAMTFCSPENRPHMTGAFNLWNWTGLNADGTLPDARKNSDHWIWNEGVPVDIAPFEGVRVVIIGPPPYQRNWSGGLIFADMFSEFVINEKLTSDEVSDWLKKLGAATHSGA